MTDDRLPLPKFLRLSLTTEAVAIGERVKRGTFRPCVETLPTSTLMSCFKDHFGLSSVVAIGFFVKGTYRKEIFTYAPFDRMIGTVKLPLTLEYLAPQNRQRPIQAEVYVSATEEARRIFTNGNTHVVWIGAFRSKGFGECRLKFEAEVQPVERIGYLRGSLRESDAPAFGIDPRPASDGGDIICPRYGYLFRPDAYRVEGKYERALLPGSILEGPCFLMEVEYPYDR